MKISNLKREDIDSCAFLTKCLQSAKYEIEGSTVGTMYNCYMWVQELNNKIAEGWNAENMPKETAEAGESSMRNVKVTNPPPSGVK